MDEYPQCLVEVLARPFIKLYMSVHTETWPHSRFLIKYQYSAIIMSC